MDLVKVDGLKKWPTPTTVKEVRQFLGFGNFYRQFIKDYSTLAALLNKLTKKDKMFEWTPQCNIAFHVLKEKFTSYPVLKVPDPNKQYLIEADTSKYTSTAIVLLLKCILRCRLLLGTVCWGLGP